MPQELQGHVARHAGRVGRVAELFAGVGGFRLGLEAAGWDVVWSNQWEPSTRTQHASDCYVRHFGPDGHTNDDIEAVLDRAIAGQEALPEFDLVVGGFPCQQYSVAMPAPMARGIEGEKGVLWWQINRLLEWRRPPYVLLENVDRLLKSPTAQRGRDFAVILACFTRLGYTVEWRVVNAADYGEAQRRRRVFLVAYDTPVGPSRDVVVGSGVLAHALPCRTAEDPDWELVGLDDDLYDLSRRFGRGDKVSVWRNAGVMSGGLAWTGRVEAVYDGPRRTLGDVLLDDEVIEAHYSDFVIPGRKLEAWRYLKGAKKEPRRDKRTGHRYFYSEGAVRFPDPLDQPSRTVLTGEGGSSPSRFKHVVEMDDGRLRRLTPVELERLNGFPDAWTEGMSDGRRAFCMGNALVVGIVERIGDSLARHRPVTSIDDRRSA